MTDTQDYTIIDPDEKKPPASPTGSLKKKEEDEMTDDNHKASNKMNEKPAAQEQQQRSSGKQVTYEVVLLDGEHINFQLDKNADGRDLFEKVCTHLDLIEKDYFGLQYVDERLPHHLKCWLSQEKKISKQKKRGPYVFDFALKFYPPDPTALRESLTRWLVTLQVRRDILSGKLPATFLTQAMLGSYNVQADIGDYDPNEHQGINYIKDIPFSPNQTPELLEKIVELHRQHKGQTPDEAELHFLENAKKLSMYGVDLHSAQDVNNVDIMLGVCASGLQVYREKLRISRFVWPKILKISYKRKHFYIKVRPSDNNQQESTVCFKLASHRLAKRLWKICVEHHAFFRLREAEQSQNSALFPRLGSKFRYSGRTLYQARHSSQILDRPDPYFERSQPARNAIDVGGRTQSADELTRTGKDDFGGDERDRRDKKDQPTYTSEFGKPYGGRLDEEGGELQRGPDDSRDRRDKAYPEGDATLERNRGGEDTMGLTGGPQETEKERKKREKEEKKRREEEEKKRREEEKKAKKKSKKDGDTSEDRRDEMDEKEAKLRAAGRTPGSYGDQEGDKDGSRWGEGPDSKQGRWDPERDRTGSEQDDRSPGHGGRPGSGRDGWGPEYAGPGSDKDHWGPGRDGDQAGKDRWGVGRDGDQPDRERWGPGGERLGPDGYWYGPDGRRLDSDSDRYGPGRDRPGSGRDQRSPGPHVGFATGEEDKDGKDKHKKDKDKDKKDKKDKDKDKKGGGLFGKFGKKHKDGEDEAGRRAPGEKGYDDGYNGDVPSWARGKKPVPLPGEKQPPKGKSEKEKSKRASLIASLCPGHSPNKKGDRRSSVPSDEEDAIEADKSAGGLGYPGYGMGVGAGDNSGVVGDESWVDNKQRFEPIQPRKQETKEMLMGGFDIDRTMPFFYPAATSTVGRPGKAPPPVAPKANSFGADDSYNRTDVPPTVATESVQYNPDLEEVLVPTKNVPIVKTETRTVTYEREGFPLDSSEDGVLVSARSHSTKMQTIETTTYKTEKDGIQETRVEHKVVVSSTDDEFDYDAALAEAIRSVTEFNPDMSVERIECVQQIEEVKDK